MTDTTGPAADLDEPRDAIPAGYSDTTDDDAETEDTPAGIKARLAELRDPGHPVRVHLDRANTRTRAWLATHDLADSHLAADILATRQRHHRARETDLLRRADRIAGQLTGDNIENPAKLVAEQELVERQLAHHQLAAGRVMATPTAGELSRVRRSRKAGRAAMLIGGVVGGGIVLPMHDPRLLLVSLPAVAIALWRAGLRPDPNDQEQAGDTVPGGWIPVETGALAMVEPVVEGPGFAAAVTAARLAAAEAATPGALAAHQVTAAAEQAAQVQGAADLINALIKAGIITKAEEEETRLVGVIRPDGPGWTATIELPGGKTAEQAIAKDTELASALRVKSAQLQLSKDTSEDGHEGRFALWVANTANPYAGAPVMSLLIGADSWDFWQQGVPLGTNARGVRKVLNMIWNSLLIGGLMNYGKSYLARLIAAAAVLDPYVKIVLLTGKTGADWAALKLVAHDYVSGNTPGAIREMHQVMEGTIAEMSAHGERLEGLFETDPKACPEGKITPELAKTEGLELTLLIVEELQEILDAAAGMKLVSADEAESAAESENGRKPAGRNGKDVMVSLFARFIRVARYVGGMELVVTQRPDSNSVPTELREVAPKRACYRVKGQNSSKMVLGEDAVAAGAAPHLLMDHHKGVMVLDEGAEDGHDTVRVDVINLDDFRVICERGRDLRLKAGTLTGQAAGRWEKEREAVQRRQVVADAIAAMDAQKVDRARLVVLAQWMAELSPERWHDLNETSLGAKLREAGAGTTVRIGKVDGVEKASGYLRETLAASLAA